VNKVTTAGKPALLLFDTALGVDKIFGRQQAFETVTNARQTLQLELNIEAVVEAIDRAAAQIPAVGGADRPAAGLVFNATKSFQCAVVPQRVAYAAGESPGAGDRRRKAGVGLFQ